MLDATSHSISTAPWRRLGTMLFNTAPFVFSRPHAGRLTFYSTERGKQGVLHLYEEAPRCWCSGWRASFGGADMQSAATSAYHLYKEMLDYGVQAGWQQLTIKLFPRAYQPAQYLMQTEVLNSLGFQTLYQDVNYHIPLTLWAPEMAANEQRRVRKCAEAGFTFHILPQDQWEPEKLYAFILASREAKGYALSLDQWQFTHMLEALPNDYLVAVVTNTEGQWVAVAVCVRINADVLYLFYPADDVRYRDYSPMTFLYKELCTWSLANGYKLLDLGTSSVEGVLNEGLANFKQKMGGYETMKPTFVFRF